MRSTKARMLRIAFRAYLSELELLKTTGKGKEEQFFIENSQRDNLPESVVLYSILDNPNLRKLDQFKCFGV
jgi:hypothetical protein